MENSFWVAVVVFVSQLVFIYLRTLNVIYTTEKKLWLSILTGVGIGFLTLVSFEIGIDSLKSGQPVPIILFLAGGAFGTWWGIRQNEKSEANSKEVNTDSSDSGKIFIEIDKLKNSYEKISEELSSVKKELSIKEKEINGNIHYRKVTRKPDGWKKEHEFVEFYSKIYVLDNGERKKNPPYVAMSSSGVIDKYDKSVGPESKLRCFMITKLVIPNYFSEKELSVAVSAGPERNNFESVFGLSYREIVALMYEHNYHRVKNEMYTLNFYEV